MDQVTTSSAARLLLPTLPSAEPLREAVLFGFDDRAFPFHNYVQIHIIPAHKPTLVLGPGPVQSHDEQVKFYGTVIRIGDLLHMWYHGGSRATTGMIGFEHGHFHLCYATSPDGIHWQKPSLGLMEFNGSRDNNIVDFPEPEIGVERAIIYEPDDPDPQRRFKMAYMGRPGGKALFCVAFSPDGLHWQPYPGNPVGRFFELAGITKFRGLYYVNGQTGGPGLPRGLEGIQRPVEARRLETFVSTDFEHWSPCAALGLERSPDVVGPSTASDAHNLEEVHIGAALWNRGNVMVGIYGQWHGHESGDRRFLTMDLGLCLTHDALFFHEPIPGFKFIPAREQPGSAYGAFPALMQGQGMENIGDRTLYWYSLWNAWNAWEQTGVRMVSWERDRLGMLKAFKPVGGQAISLPVRVLEGGKARLYINANGLCEHSRLRVGLLDEGFRPIAGHSSDDAAVISGDGLRVPVRWAGGDVVSPPMGAVRLDIRFEGLRPEDCALHAAYVVGEE